MIGNRFVKWFLAGMVFCFSLVLSTGAEGQQRIRVACIGDSITQGVGAREGMAYPAQLQSMFGAGWEVGNFGVSGRTLLRKGDFPWWNEKAYTDAQSFNPDIVVIMLGTNDTKPQNWKYVDEFYSDYSDLVDLFAGLPSTPKIYVCRPCPVPAPGNWGINEANVLAEIKMIDRLASEKGLGLIDMHAALEAHPELLPDRVHPNTEGARIMAATVFKAVTGQPVPPQVNSYFQDHAVLQRGVRFPVWGTEVDGEKVSVSFKGKTYSATVENGQWKAWIDPLTADAEPAEMIISNERAESGCSRIFWWAISGSPAVSPIWSDSSVRAVDRRKLSGGKRR